MKIIVESFNTPQIWRHGGATAKLRIYANGDFVTGDGQWVGAGHLGNLESYYLEATCTIAGFVLTAPSVEVDSTVDALINPNVRYNAEFIAENGKRIPFISGFAVNTLESGDPSMTWGEILAIRNGPTRPSFTIPLFRQIASMISLAVGLLNKSSETNTGVTALTTDPVDPTFPIAVSETDPLIQSLRAGIGLLIATGTATMVVGADSRATVPTALVTPASKIMPYSMDANVSGALHIENIVDGVSFDIVSNNTGDEGSVEWSITA